MAKIDGRSKYLGLFDSVGEASAVAAAYRAAHMSGSIEGPAA